MTKLLIEVACVIGIFSLLKVLFKMDKLIVAIPIIGLVALSVYAHYCM